MTLCRKPQFFKYDAYKLFFTLFFPLSFFYISLTACIFCVHNLFTHFNLFFIFFNYLSQLVFSACCLRFICRCVCIIYSPISLLSVFYVVFLDSLFFYSPSFLPFFRYFVMMVFVFCCYFFCFLFF